MTNRVAITIVSVCACVWAAAPIAWAQAGPPAPATQPAAGKPAVKVVGLSIALPDKSGEPGRSMAFGVLPGTAVFFSISDNNRFFVKLDTEASKLESFTDDKGMNLLKQEGWAGSMGFGSFPKIAKDGHTCALDVHVNNPPSPGARELTIKGRAVLLCGGPIKQAQQKDVALTKGTKVSAGAFEADISDVREENYGNGKVTMVAFKGDKSPDAVKSVTFLGPDGKAVESDLTMTGHMGFAGSGSYMQEYSLKSKPDAVTIVVDYFQTMDKLEVPIDATVSVGL